MMGEIHLIPGHLLCPEQRKINHLKRANTSLLVSFFLDCTLILVARHMRSYAFCDHSRFFSSFLPFIQLTLDFFFLYVSTASQMVSLSSQTSEHKAYTQEEYLHLLR